LRTLEPQQATFTATIRELKMKIQGVEDRQKPKDPKKEEPAPTQEELNNLPLWRTELATRRAELEAVKRQLADAKSSAERPTTDGFLSDVLSDINGPTFHRLQIVVWTVVLGLIFILSVWRKLAMPEFSETLLALMGISAGTYIGFKIPERQTAPDTQPPPAKPTPPAQPPAPPQAQPAPSEADKPPK
jgi:hypothetical protein